MADEDDVTAPKHNFRKSCFEPFGPDPDPLERLLRRHRNAAENTDLHRNQLDFPASVADFITQASGLPYFSLLRR